MLTTAAGLALLLVNVTPSVGQGQPLDNSVRIVVLDRYPAFDSVPRVPGVRPGEVWAIAFLRDTRGPSFRNSPALTILLNPRHLDAATLRAGLAAIHNHLARGGPYDQAGFVALGQPPVTEITPEATRRLMAVVNRLRIQPVQDVPGHGRGRVVMISDPRVLLFPESGGR